MNKINNQKSKTIINIFGYIVIVGLLSCNSPTIKSTNPSKSSSTKIDDSTEKFKALANNRYLSTLDSIRLDHLSQVFFNAIKTNNTENTTADLLKMHAHAMRSDYLNKLPYTLSYPYTLQQTSEEVNDILDSLSFLTKQCGFEFQDSVYHYSCLKYNSSYMSYLADDVTSSSLITGFLTSYKEHKEITSDIKQQMLLSAPDDLDFTHKKHINFYILFHYLVNEERLAYQQLSEKN